MKNDIKLVEVMGILMAGCKVEMEKTLEFVNTDIPEANRHLKECALLARALEIVAEKAIDEGEDIGIRPDQLNNDFHGLVSDDEEVKRFLLNLSAEAAVSGMGAAIADDKEKMETATLMCTAFSKAASIVSEKLDRADKIDSIEIE